MIKKTLLFLHKKPFPLYYCNINKKYIKKISCDVFMYKLHTAAKKNCSLLPENMKDESFMNHSLAIYLKLIHPCALPASR